MAQLLKPPMRFTVPEWAISNNAKFRNAENSRQGSERLQNESDRLIDETDKRTKKTLTDANKKIDQSIDDINYWKGELDKKHEDLGNETDKLDIYIRRLGKALEASEEPLHLAQQCLIFREDRKAIDLVTDDTHKELLKEVEVNQGVQALLQKTLEQAKEQLRLNRKAQYRLANDIRDKFKAKNIDEHISNLTTMSQDIGYVDGVTNFDPNSVSMQEWVDSSDANNKNAARELANSQNMRSIIDGVLQQIYNDLKSQKEAVDTALKRNITEVKDVKGKLEDHLNRVLKEISNLEDTIRNIQDAIEDKKSSLMLTETRLDVRRDRPNVENKRDPAQFRLIEEVTEINADIKSLGNRLFDCNSSLKDLNRRKLDLEEDIQTKTNTIFIDEVQVTGIRQSINIQSF